MLQRGVRKARSALLRPGRRPGLRTAKTTLAVVAAFLLAEWLQVSDHPVVAPLTALLAVQLTLYETLVHGLGRVAGVVTGVLVAVGLADLVGFTWWSLGLVIAGSLIVGRLLGLGPYLFEVPISAMLVLEVGGGRDLAVGRILEALIGAGVGVGVSALIAPPLYLQPAGAAIEELADRMAAFARGFALGLLRPWSRGAADHWLKQARSLAAEAAHAEAAVERAEQSLRFNPRGRQARDAQPRLRSTLAGLERCQITLRTLTRTVLDRTYFMPLEQQSSAYTPAQRTALADVLKAVAAAMQSIDPIAISAGSPDVARHEVAAHLATMFEHRDRLSGLLAIDPETDQGAWKQHGSLLDSLDRLAVEIEAAAREPETRWQPD